MSVVLLDPQKDVDVVWTDGSRIEYSVVCGLTVCGGRSSLTSSRLVRSSINLRGAASGGPCTRRAKPAHLSSKAMKKEGAKTAQGHSLLNILPAPTMLTAAQLLALAPKVESM